MTVWGFVGGPHCLPDQMERLAGAGAVRVLSQLSNVAEALRLLSR
jgi:hypothetical protein